LGDRGNIVIRDNIDGDAPDLYLYTHWRGSELHSILKYVLSRRQRWDDGPYLARIIFCEMVRGYEREDTGFGIATYWPDTGVEIVVDVKKQTVNDVSFEEYVSRK